MGAMCQRVSKQTRHVGSTFLNKKYLFRRVGAYSRPQGGSATIFSRFKAVLNCNSTFAGIAKKDDGKVGSSSAIIHALF